MTHNKRDRLSQSTTVLFMTVNSTPAGHELIQAKKRELINLGVIKEEDDAKTENRLVVPYPGGQAAAV